MKINICRLLRVASAAFFVACAPALAQWQVPNNSPAIGQGAGTGFKAITAGTNGQVFLGATNAPPAFSTMSGDCTIAAAGAITCIKTNGVALGTMATQNANSVSITGGAITGMSAPVAPSDVARKQDVDAVASGLIVYPAMTLATAAVLPNTPTYANGAAGVGATLTAGSNTTLTVDGTAAPLNTLVLVKNQASTFQNGFYFVSAAGSGAAPWILTRCTLAACGKEFDSAATMLAGSYAAVTSGSTNTNTAWVLAATVTTVGTTPATFNLFSNVSAGVSTLNLLNGALSIVAGTGVSVTPAGSNITIVNTLPGRVRLSSVTQFYIRTDGSDSNTCLVDNAGGACLTLQGAYDKIYGTYDFVGTGSATVNIRAGTYSCAVNCLLVLGTGPVGTPSGSATAISFVGDNSTPSNVLLSAVGAAVLASWGGQINISGVKMTSSGGNTAYASALGRINFTNFVDFGAAVGVGAQANVNGVIVFNSGYFISGGALGHLYASKNGTIELNAATVTNPIGGVPAFGTFATSIDGGTISAPGVGFALTASGPRYLVDFGTITGTSGNINYFPGNVAGTTSVFGGKYNFLLKRDLAPAANDNTPMFLNLAA